MIIYVYVLMALGALVTFFSGKVAELILLSKRQPNEADIVYTKLVGFLCVLTAVILIFILKGE